MKSVSAIKPYCVFPLQSYLAISFRLHLLFGSAGMLQFFYFQKLLLINNQTLPKHFLGEDRRWSFTLWLQTWAIRLIDFTFSEFCCWRSNTAINGLIVRSSVEQTYRHMFHLSLGLEVVYVGWNILSWNTVRFRSHSRWIFALSATVTEDAPLFCPIHIEFRNWYCSYIWYWE